MTTCSICGQQVPVNELQEHMRIELLDPRWKSQRDALEARKAQASELQRGANVVSSLKNLARTRTDIFGAEADEERRKIEEEEERRKRREREKVVWDGHTATKANTLDKYSTNVNFDEQIAAIHRAKGLGPLVSFEQFFYCFSKLRFLGKKLGRSGPELDLPRRLQCRWPNCLCHHHCHRHPYKQPGRILQPRYHLGHNPPRSISHSQLQSCCHPYTTRDHTLLNRLDTSLHRLADQLIWYRRRVWSGQQTKWTGRHRDRISLRPNARKSQSFLADSIIQRTTG